VWSEDIREKGAEENVPIQEGKTREFGENCIVTGSMIHYILFMEDEMCGALVRGGKQKLLKRFPGTVVPDGRRGPGSSVVIATDYGLGGPGIESRWE
jgi:hypothetical protein